MTDADVRQFELDVGRWIEAAHARDVTTFAGVVDSLPGVYPADVHASLCQIRESKPFLAAWVSHILSDMTIPPLETNGRRWRKPVPHALDYDWRFTGSTVEYTMSIIESLSTGSRGALFIGVPSVFEAARKKWARSANVGLIDLNASGEQAESNVWRLDITCAPLPKYAADLVVTDPPWYAEHFRSFLWAAAAMVNECGSVLCGIPAEGSRPGMISAWREIEAWAREIGLVVKNVHKNMLRYQTPPFELNALRAAGIQTNLGDWRKGSLVEFSRSKVLTAQRPVGAVQEWEEIIIGSVRWKWRVQQERSPGDPRLYSLVEGDILPTVSRRDTRRELVSVWTSGNRVFRCQDTHAFAMLLKHFRQELHCRRASASIANDDATNPLPDLEILRCIERIQRREEAEYGES